MCGIAGVFGAGDKTAVRRMTNALKHRGPDDFGYFFGENVSLGHRRLSIIGTNRSGRQPIFNEDKTVAVVYNGEIYNFRELKKSLEANHEFYTDTDTEVIVHLYERFGLDFVKHLEGMFAFALFDFKKKRLVLARDHMGIKPLFYAKTKGGVVFASEAKSVFASGYLKPEFEPRSVKEKLVFGDYFLGSKTLFKKLNQVPPQCIVVAQKNSVEVVPYARRSYTKKISSEAVASKKVFSLLRQSVESRLLSDVPLGTLLSGGLDSSVVAAMHREVAGDDADIMTFSVTDEEGSVDSENARIMAQHIGSRHFEYTFSAEEMKKHFPKFIYHLEDTEYGIMYNYFLSKYTKKHATVVLSGNGSDEVFAGYKRFKKIDSLKKNWRALAKKTEIHDRELAGEIESVKTKTDLLKFEQNRGQLSNFQLAVVDRTSMASSVEVRVPFLQKPLVEFANSLDMGLKIKNSEEKFILRKAAAKLKMPKSIVSREKLPAGLANTNPQTIPEFEAYCSELARKRKKTPFDRFLRNDALKISFDVLKHIYVENEGQFPSRMELQDLY
jgi:asparagine synthase (glutamine-hydrolysing)